MLVEIAFKDKNQFDIFRAKYEVEALPSVGDILNITDADDSIPYEVTKVSFSGDRVDDNTGIGRLLPFVTCIILENKD